MPLYDVPDDSAVDQPTPQWAEAELPSTTERVPEATPETETDTEHPFAGAAQHQPERLALRTETVDRPLPPRAAQVEPPADASAQSTASGPTDVTAETMPTPTTDAPIAETATGASQVPSFKITATLPPTRQERESATVITVNPLKSTPNATIRFTTEGTSSVRVGAAQKTDTGTSLRFR